MANNNLVSLGFIGNRLLFVFPFDLPNSYTHTKFGFCLARATHLPRPAQRMVFQRFPSARTGEPLVDSDGGCPISRGILHFFLGGGRHFPEQSAWLNSSGVDVTLPTNMIWSRVWKRCTSRLRWQIPVASHQVSESCPIPNFRICKLTWILTPSPLFCLTPFFTLPPISIATWALLCHVNLQRSKIRLNSSVSTRVWPASPEKSRGFAS